jgi:hypothetical protein
LQTPPHYEALAFRKEVVFMQSPNRTRTGRAAQSFTDPSLVQKFRDEVNKVLPSDLLLPPSSIDHDAFKRLACPAAFGIDASIEKDTFTNPLLMASLRVACQGTRQVFMVFAGDVLHFVCSESCEHQIQNATVEQLSAFARDHIMSGSQLAAFCKQHKVWTVTLGEGDVLYTPAGFITCERYLNKSDVYGVKELVIANPRQLFGNPSPQAASFSESCFRRAGRF